MERAFRILHSQFAIVKGPARFRDQDILWYNMNACVIMHNMIIKDECRQDLNYSNYEFMRCTMQVQMRKKRVNRFIVSYHSIRQADVHDEDKKELMDQWWSWRGQ